MWEFEIGRSQLRPDLALSVLLCVQRMTPAERHEFEKRMRLRVWRERFHLLGGHENEREHRARD